MKKLLSFCFAFLSITSYISAAPGNDACAGAVSMPTVTGTSAAVTGDFFQATQINPGGTSCGNQYDVWYRFVVPANVNYVDITVTLTSSTTTLTSTNTFIELFNSNTCTPSTNIGGCNNISSTRRYTVTAGSTLLFRLYETAGNPSANAANWGFNVSVRSNDGCTAATPYPTITGNTSSLTGNFYLASQSNPGGSTCGARYDLWYSFVVPAGSTFVDIAVTLTSATTSLNNTNTFIEVFNSGTCTPSANLGGCNDISATRRITGLTGGSTYLFRISETQGNPNVNPANWAFDINITSNDNCATATTIIPGSTVTSESVRGASASGTPVDCATGTPDDDVWFSFTPAYTYASITLGNIGSNFAASGTRIQLYSSTTGCTLTTVACSSTNVLDVTGLSTSTLYYIRVYSSGAGQAGTNWGFQISLSPSATTQVGSSRMNEVYNKTIISPASVLNYPWEVTYGPDNNLWITESKGYRIYKVNPTTGVRDTVLDISQGSTTSPNPAFNCQFANGAGAQGGLAGLAIHPQFLDGTHDFVYVSYIFSQGAVTDPNGNFFTNRVVRFTYSGGKLISPVIVCDTIPGSSDHNSQRMIIAPVGGVSYLFYAAGDMGAGQFSNRLRTNKAQNPASYEGKILRFNLEPDLDAGSYDKWIPSGAFANPYNATLGVQSAVYSIGIRNNQGFAYDPALSILYGSSHGPFSDDEINIIEGGKNYGHPKVIGYYIDGNYNGITAGSAPGMAAGGSSCPTITSETTERNLIGAATYRDPIFSAYTTPTPVAPTNFTTMSQLWNNTSGANDIWPSEGWSGLDLYTSKIIPGWYKSLVASGLKWGRLIRVRMGATGITTMPSNLSYLNTADTVTYFQSTNRYRDLAFAPNGKDIYVIMDNSSATSGPGVGNPTAAACPGCLLKYTFLGYADATGVSSIPKSIAVTDPGASVNTCVAGTQVTIDDTNNSLWVPITGPDGNIMAEINAMGQNLGIITSSFYKNTGAIRIKNGVHYLDRNITITPAVTSFSTPVKVRLYISKAEFDALDLDALSGVSAITDLKILKNNDACGSAITNSTTLFSPTNTLVADLTQGTSGYVLQTAVPGFSSFYFATANVTLPLDLISFTGSLQNDNTTLLQWKTENENNTSHFVVERSIDAVNFSGIGNVPAAGNNSGTLKYSLVDADAANQQSLILYYRLKMVDNNGAYKYSNVISVSFADITGAVSIAPNPVRHEAKVTIIAPADGSVQYKLIDNAGRTILQKAFTARKGSNNNVTIDMDKLSSGMYFLNVTGAGLSKNIKLQKL